ncbi:MAG: response regulator [Treponema sp.]|jgi:chemotaxis protein histidine kinase CheA|nr:response regulator [Treponema sp.]
MAINKEKYIGKYIDEGLENIALIETLIFDIKEGVSVEDDLATLLRTLHTLKGSSRMLEFKRIENLSHSLESVFVAFREQRIGLSEKAVKLILSSLDLLKSGFDAIKNTKDDAVDIQENTENLSLLAANEEFNLPKAADTRKKDMISDGENIIPPKQTESNIQSEKQQREQKKDLKSESIRLSIDKINGIIKSIASLQSLEISAKSISQDSAALNRMIAEYSKILKNYGKQEPALAENFRKLERLSERLNSSLKNYAIDAGNSIRGAYDSVISLRTLPVSTIFDNYPRYVFELSSELGKKVQFSIEGKENEIDKNIIESLSEVFIHMVRNSIDHGIETPQERTAARKSETGKLSIVCSRESGSMKIVISDDGRGIDHEKIRQKAVQEGLLTEAAAASLSKEELTNFIFQSGFSTSGKVSSVSGRGVGMDVVRESIEALKGSIIVDSVWGKGTAFTIMVPLSIAALMGFPITCGTMKFIIPANFVDTIMLINKEDIITVVDRPEIKYNDRIIKLYYLSHILEINYEKAMTSDVIFVVIIRSYEDIAALAVDNINSMRSVILKTMPELMENIPVFSGIVLNEDYEMVSVLHIPTVIKMAKRIKPIDIKKRGVKFEKLRKSILVVDDSKPTREIESEILLSEGYAVDTAVDGSQALKAAKTKHYDLICTDLNMPVMDGFMFLENIKKNEDLSKIPVIVISSITNEKDQKRAYKLGASRYIIKNSFNNSNLLIAVNELIGGTNER